MPSFLDRCIINATSTGTGDFVQASAVTGYQTMGNAGAVNGGTYRYTAQSADLSQWEYGLGTWTTSTTTLARTTVIQTSGNSTAKISFSSVPTVMVGGALGEDFSPLGAFASDSDFTYAGLGQATLALGTITANAKALNITGTWNAIGTTFDAPLFMNITNTASAAGSLLIDLQVGGSSAFSVDKIGNIFLGGNTGTFNTTISTGNSNDLHINAAGGIIYDFGANFVLPNSVATVFQFSAGNGNTFPKLYGENSGALALGNSGAPPAPMALRVYKSTDSNTSPTNYEVGVFDWTTTTNVLTIGTQAGGTGTLRGVSIVGNSLKMGSAGMFTANGAVATVLGSLGPTGASTTVTKWLTIIDNGGTIPLYPLLLRKPKWEH